MTEKKTAPKKKALTTKDRLADATAARDKLTKKWKVLGGSKTIGRDRDADEVKVKLDEASAQVEKFTQLLAAGY